MSKGRDPDQSPWARESLRREIHYLQALPDRAARWFPNLQRAWGHNEEENGQELGYEIPYFDSCLDASTRIRLAAPIVQSIDRETFQSSLARALFDDVHEPLPRRTSLASHVSEVLSDVCVKLGSKAEFHAAISSGEIVIEGQRTPGLDVLRERLTNRNLLPALDGGLWVRLHGDLILENILCSRAPEESWEVRCLIDPVSVAGIGEGPPLFDLVKYESYASGELPAFRNGHVVAHPITERDYAFSWSHKDEALSPYQQGLWHLPFRKHFEASYGPINWPLYHVLDAYFSLVMALNTEGTQRWARLLKGIRALNLALVPQ